jgi:hypothetical protein
VRLWAAAAASVFRNRSLARVVAAYALFIGSEYAAWISVLVWAYGEGGSSAAGAIALAQLLPAAVAAPVVASLADRRSPGTVLVGGYVVQAAALAATAATAATGVPVLVWLCAIAAATSVVTTRPAQAALLPAVVLRVEELGAANATLGWVEGTGIVVAGVMSGVVVGGHGASAGIAAAAALAAVAAVAAAPAARVPRLGASGDSGPLRDELRAGVAVVRTNGAPALILALQTAAWTVVGALDILFVVLAIRILRDGAGWVGYLNTAYGAGGLAAGLAAASFVGGRRLSLPIAGGAAVLAVALAILAAAPSTVAAVGLLACAGAGRVVFDVSTRTLMQRIVPADAIGRVFGMVEGLSMAGLAVGSIAVPGLVWAVGARGAVAAVAAILPAAALAGGRRLLLLDRTAHVPVVEIALLRSLPLFRWLPAPSLEASARALVPVELAVGDVLIQEGDANLDRFYALASGEVDVLRHDTHVATLGRGQGVGEMALLRSIPRTATVVARTPVLAYALERESFLVAVTGHAATATAADAVVDERLADLAAKGLAAE